MKEMARILILLIALGMLGSCASSDARKTVGAGAGAKTLNADLVVIGAGTAGLAAAAQSAQKGLSVIVLEKLGTAGGCLNFSEGAFAVGSSMQKSLGIDISEDFAFEQMMSFNHWNNDGRVVRAFMKESGKTIDWMKSIGVVFKEVSISLNGDPNSSYFHLYGGAYEAQGPGVVKVFMKNLEKSGVKVLFQTPATDLLIENGKLVGVAAKAKDGTEYRIQSKAAVIATGGFANNKNLFKKYTGIDLAEMFYFGQPGHDGDGLSLAFAAGGAEFGARYVQFVGGVVPVPFDNNLATLSQQPYLMVNKVGIRFVNEALALPNERANALSKQPGNVQYLIFDGAAVEQMKTSALLGPRMLAPHSTDPMPDLEKDLGAGMKSGLVSTAPTVEELALKLGMDAATLKATVDEYSAQCLAGRDAWFNKPARFLKPIGKGPFYALKLQHAMLGTIGGIKINENAEVVDSRNKAIAGLYAAGADAGGIYGDSYNYGMSGVTQGFALTFGRIAAMSAASYIGK